MEEVNLAKAQCRVYSFQLFVGAAQACLFPFFSLYLRFLGLSAMQTGIVLGARSVTNMFSAPCWGCCAKRTQKRRFVLLFSLFVLIGSYLTITLIPPVNVELSNTKFCSYRNRVLIDTNISAAFNSSHHEGITISTPVIHTEIATVAAMATTTKSTTGLPTVTELTLLSTSSVPHGELATSENPLQVPDTKEVETGTSFGGTDEDNENETGDEYDEGEGVDGGNVVHKSSHSDTSGLSDAKLTKLLKLSMDDLNDMSAEQLKALIGQLQTRDTSQEGGKSHLGKVKEHLSNMDTSQVGEKSYWKKEKEHLSNRDTSQVRGKLHLKKKKEHLSNREKRDVNGSTQQTPKTDGVQPEKSDEGGKFQDEVFDSVANFINKLSDLPTKINAIVQEKVYLVVLAVVVVGELFSAPTSRLADDIWFDFLDSTDMLEKYGTHKIWSCIGYALIPPVITAVIDHVPCMLPNNASRITIHFYCFAAFAGVAFLAAFCYPVNNQPGTRKKIPRAKIFKGMRMLCGGIQPAIFTCSMILMGVFQGCLMTFLFWQVQDKAGTELVMGLSLTAAFISEFLLLLIQRWLVRKMGSAGAVTLGLFVLSLRFVLYSFLWNPWLVLIGEGLHIMSTGMVCAGVHDFPDFRQKLMVMDRSAKNVLDSLYHGLGLGAGCALSGFLYDKVGVAILFQGCAVLSFVWCIVFIIIYKCTVKPHKIHYSKLLQEEEENMSDASMEYDDDWLEVAMQHQT